MAATPPNRDGWVTGALASYPACPPFPDFTNFERQVLEQFALTLDHDGEAFRTQIQSAVVVDRINTFVGFYTRVSLDRSKCRPSNVNRQTASCEVAGVAHGMGIVLWGDDGFLETIEGFRYVDDTLEERDLADLDLLGFRRS
jgi:hypothetical protein